MQINLYRSGDTEETLNYKLRLWESLMPAPIIMAISGSVVHLLGLPRYAIAMWIFGGYVMILAGALLILRRHERVIAGIMLYCSMIFSIFVTILFGGILESGGVVFLGLAAAMFSMSFLDRRHTNILFGIYLLFLSTAPFIEPHIHAIEVLPPRINLFLFVAHILVVAINIYAVTSHFLEESIQLKAREAEQLKELDKMKSDFYTNISHEFRTPLTVIIGMAEQILKKPESLLVKGAKAIRKNGHRLLYLVNQMMDLAKLESGSLTLDPVQDDVILFLEFILEPFVHLAEENDIHLNTILLTDSLIMDFDPDRLESVIGNLVSNAIKHAPSGSDVEIIISNDSNCLDEEKYHFKLFTDPFREMRGNYLMFSIKDDGPGINPKNIPLIFDRFYQEKNNQIKLPSGTGIGLALVKDLLELMNGQLYVHSLPGQGTEFKILIPVTHEAKKRTASYVKNTDTSEESLTSASKLSGTHRQLLIIEDNYDITEYISSVLQNEYDISYASDGSEGIEKAKTLLPDVIISDVMMPVKDGYEVCTDLKNDPHTSHIPIILLTARADRASKIIGLESGADAYLVKPFDSQELKTRLRKLWQLRESLQQKYQTMALTGVNQSLPENHDTKFMIRVKEVIEQHLDDPEFDINQLAKELHTNRTQLYRKIKSLTGYSASELLRTIRLNRAKDLLIRTDLNISEIGYEVGYKDPAYFSRVFTREFGVNPSTQRDQLNSRK